MSSHAKINRTTDRSSKDSNLSGASNVHSHSREELGRLLSLCVLQKLQNHQDIDDDAFREVIADVIGNDASCKKMTLGEKRELALGIFNSMRRLDVLQPMMEDPSITEIMVNGYNCVFFEREGSLHPTDIRFKDPETMTSVLSHFFSRANRPLNEASPIADLRLPDGSRANAVLPPVAPDGPILTIRKFTGIRPDMNSLIRQEFLSAEAADYLSEAVRIKKTIFICGGTGSGKTTFLNTLSSFIPENERVVTIEDSAELSLQGLPNLVRLEARLPGPDGQGAVSIGRLIRTALRMRPDRIIVGEVRGSEAADMLHALHTGHPGSLCTGHANSCVEMLNRLSTMVLAGSSLPFEAVVRQIVMGIDILVHIVRSAGGRRLVGEIVTLDHASEDAFRVVPQFVYKEDSGLEKV